MRRPITIALAEDHEFVRKGFISILENYAHIKVIFDVADGKELMQKLKRTQPKIILLDIELPDQSGLTLLVEIKKLYPKIKIIIMSAHYKKPFIVEAVKKGANAFLPKGCGVDEVNKAIDTVFSEGNYFSADILAMLKNDRNEQHALTIRKQLKKKETLSVDSSNVKEELSNQDLTIIELILLGKTNKEISSHLNLHEKTIELRRAKIYKKAGVVNIIGLMKFALKSGIIKSV